MTSTSSHQGGFDEDEDFYEDDEPVADVLAAFERGQKFLTGGIIPASEAASGDSLPPFLTGCDYILLAPGHAAEDAERRAIARRRPPHWAGED